MSGSNCCFLTCIQISQEGSQVIWYSHLLKNFPQFAVTHTVKGFGVVNKAEEDVFSGTLLLFYGPVKKWSEVKSLSHVWHFATPWTVAYQASPSMGFSRQEYWSGLPFPSPGDLPDPGIEPGSPALEADTLMSVGNLISGSSAISKSSLNIWKFTAHVLLKPCLENFGYYFASMWDEYNCVAVWAFFGIAFLWD